MWFISFKGLVLFGENRMLEDNNSDRKAKAMVQEREEASCMREARVEMERKGTFKVHFRWQ